MMSVQSDRGNRERLAGLFPGGGFDTYCRLTMDYKLETEYKTVLCDASVTVYSMMRHDTAAGTSTVLGRGQEF